MNFTKDSATEQAKTDLATRLDVDEASVKVRSVSDQEFPDMSLGAATDGEMSAQMIANGWKIELDADGCTYEYRADKYQLRLVDFEGGNHLVEEVK